LREKGDICQILSGFPYRGALAIGEILDLAAEAHLPVG
jgi:hypothetical protein